MIDEIREKIKNFVEESLSKAGFAPEEVVVREEGEGFAADVNVSDAGLLIGEDGANLSAWEHVLRVFAQQHAGKFLRVSFDVNHYRAIKNEALREIAKKAAREAVLKKKSVELEPMNAYERRIVHTELALRPDVMTESVGEEPNRRVVVKPL